jgi:hypothetical protein
VHPSATSYTVRLPHTLRDVVSASLVTAELPSAYPTISASLKNQTLSMTRNGMPLAVTIDDGCYSVSTLVPALRRLLAPLLLDVDVSLITRKCTISSSASSPSPTDTLTVEPTGLGPVLGFTAAVSPGTGAVTAHSLFNLNPPSSVYVEIIELGSPVMMDPSTFSRCVFAKIPLNANSFEVVAYDKRLSEHVYAKPLATVDRLRLRWRFPDGQPVEFGGLEHSLTLSVTCRRPTRALPAPHA